MKKSALPAALLLIATGLSGCPIYEDDTEPCWDDRDCGAGYLCDGPSGNCVAEAPAGMSCEKPSDCGENETCARSASCVPGDCRFTSVGCVRGYECSSASGHWECVAEGAGQGGSDAGAGAGASSGGSPSETSAGAANESTGGTAAEAGAASASAGVGG